MEHKMISHSQLWFAIFIAFPLFSLFFYALDFSTLNGGTQGVTFILNSFTNVFSTQKPVSLDFPQKPNETVSITLIDSTNPVTEVPLNFSVSFDVTMNETNAITELGINNSCAGRYIYVHDLPSRFNDAILRNCTLLMKWFDLCPCVANMGLGPRVQNPEGVLLENSWYATNQFFLEVIFRNRMKSYKCLTDDSSIASAIYVPFYAGLDVGRYLWDHNTSITDSLALDLVKWLRERPEWTRMRGRDHFFVAGRIGWDFRRRSENDYDWGSRLMSLPESMNLTMLSIESTSWSNEFAIPYPTYFHPSNDADVFLWQKRMKRRKRQYLFSFAGAPRPGMKGSIRAEIIRQCLASGRKCKLLNCSSSGNKCDNPVEVVKVFQNSVFCLQPPGDSYTRRSTFDSILAGCIPVFFHPGSAYGQYTWHFPKNYTKYSIFIPVNLIKEGRFSIYEALRKVPKSQVFAMRKEVIKLIPKVIYANPESKLESIEDAFDIAVKGVLKRVEKERREIKEGKDPSVGFAEENSWKIKLSGTGKEDEWDHFF